MEKIFINEDHEFRFWEYTCKTSIDDDVNKKSFFYIIAGKEELNNNIKDIYNFKEDKLLIDNANNLSISSSSKILLNLAIHLYLSVGGKFTVDDKLIYLDTENMDIATKAIMIRYNI